MCQPLDIGKLLANHFRTAAQFCGAGLGGFEGKIEQAFKALDDRLGDMLEVETGVIFFHAQRRGRAAVDSGGACRETTLPGHARYGRRPR